MRSPDIGSAESMSTITWATEGVLLGCSNIEIKNNRVGNTTVISQETAVDGPTLQSKPTGR